MPLVSLEDVSAGYRYNPVFAHVSLQFPAGRFAGLVGPSGCGKTTLLKTLLGAVPVVLGRVRVGAATPTRLPRGLVGYVPQLGTLDWDFPVTVEQVILMGLNCRPLRTPWPTQAEQASVRALARRLGIFDCLHHPVRDLSGGQQQRAFLGRALIAEPQLLLLDEPTAGVDVATQHDILELLKEFNGEGVTILLTTHDLNAVAMQLPWVICFNRQVVAQGVPREVFSDDVMSATFGDVARVGGL